MIYALIALNPIYRNYDTLTCGVLGLLACDTRLLRGAIHIRKHSHSRKKKYCIQLMSIICTAAFIIYNL
ncbi:MAG: hypothetical protein JNJ47_00710 [Alphaproteobacteria bacterium]|nr:hypothetical protein [Alphaproteobacteria bacterium]